MDILVIGATSVIGKSVCAHLLSQGLLVKQAGRKDADIKFDLTEWNEIIGIQERFDTVLHFAAEFSSATDQDLMRTELTNAVGTLKACILANQAGAKHFVLISTISASYEPDDPYYGIYGLSKRHGEELAKLYCEKNSIKLTILRLSQVYDDCSDARHHQNLFYLIADRAQFGEEVVIYGTHDAQRNYIHISDVTEIVSRVVLLGVAGYFTCAHPSFVRISDMARCAFSAFEQDPQIRFLTDKPDMVDLPQITDFSIYERVGYSPLINIDEGYIRIKNYREMYA